MSIEKKRAQIVASIWQAIAQSEGDLSSLPKEQQEDMVGKIADQVMLTINGMLDEESEAPTVELDELDERILWQGRPFLSLVESYILTNERLKIVKGLLSRDVENFELIRIQDIDLSQGVSDRILGIGDIEIKGHDPSDPEVVLRNVSDPEKVYEALRRTWLEARKRHGLEFREFM
jgi:hypothetical protein